MTAYRRWILLCCSLLLLPAFTPRAQQASALAPAAPTGLQVIIRLPPAAPVVNITVPTSASTYDAGTATTVALAGTATTLSSITGCTWINSLGGSGAAVGGIAWSIASVGLTIGSNVVTVTCTDINGQTGTDVLTVTRSTPAGPTVTITTPTASPTFDAGTSSSLTVAGTAAPNTPATITSCTWVNNLGGSGVASGTTSWSVASLPLTVGSNIVTVTCTDSFSQPANDVITITRSAGGGGGANIIAGARLPDGDTTLPNPAFASAGATIVNRTTQCGSTLAAGTSAATINAAIQACPSGQFVHLGTGNFAMNSSIIFNGKNDVTLRGDGANATFLTFSGTGLCTYQVDFCVEGSGSYINHETFTTNWTAGYAKGTTVLTLQNTANIFVGAIITLDQLNDGVPDTFPQTWYCNTTGPCVIDGDSGTARQGRSMNQQVVVVSKTATTVTITPGLYHANWSASRTPQVAWGDGVITGIGIEDLSVNNNNTGLYTFDFLNAKNSWIKGVRMTIAFRAHVLLSLSTHITMRDSYMFLGGQLAATSYGVEWESASLSLMENNISQRTVVPFMMQSGETNVVGYNFTINQPFDNGVGGLNCLFGGIWTHSTGADFNLWEGNDTAGFQSDIQHGGSNFSTTVRNYLWGREFSQTECTMPLYLRAENRFHNALGNVLGTSGYHTLYQCSPGACANEETSIYSIGMGDFGNAMIPDDPRVVSTMFRWGNYDTVNAATRFVAAEVPTGLTVYANPLPGANTVPNSLYLTGRPSWWPVAKPWPSVGPDVTGGNVSNVGGHVYTAPARDCFYTVMGGTGTETTALTFNRATCYPGS